MTPGRAVRIGLQMSFRIVGPVVLTLIPYAAWILINRAMVNGDLPIGLWVWLLLPPALYWEWQISHHMDPAPVRTKGRLPARLDLWCRLLVMSVYFYVLIGRTSFMMDSPDVYCRLIGYWPVVAGLAYVASPVLGSISVTAMVGLYLWLTVRLGRYRLTTTLLIPLSFSLVLFHFYYAFPTSPLHMISLDVGPPVERVFPFDDVDVDTLPITPPFFARALYVTEDESKFVATYGATFRIFSPDDGVNLAWVDLRAREVQVRRGSSTRQFQSTCSQRLYAAPWHGSTVEEIDPVTFETRPIQLPSELNGEPVEEINFVLHDCEQCRVYIANSLNPAVFVWNTCRRNLEKTVNLVGLNGFGLGDMIGVIRKNPKDGRIYVLTQGPWNLIELDPTTLEPLRFARFPGFPMDLQPSSDGAWLYATSFFTGKIWKMDSATLETVATFHTPIHCRRLEVTADGSRLIVLSYLTGEILSLDAETGEELVRYRVGPKAEGLFLSRNYAWVSSATGVYRIPLEALISLP